MAEQQTSWLDRIRKHLPEFPGYMDPATRIHADRILRKHLGGKISCEIERLGRFIQSSAAEKRLDLLSDFEDIQESLGELSGRVSIDYVYDQDAWTSAVISDEQLARIHENDGELADAVQSVHDRITALEEPVPERPEVLLLKDAVDRLQGYFKDRFSELEELGLVGDSPSG